MPHPGGIELDDFVARRADTTHTPPSLKTAARRLLTWFVGGARDLPWRRTLDPYAIWVSEIMLQQTQVRTVISYYERWLRELPDVASLATVPAGRLHKLWEGLGYYTRVRNLQRAAQQIITQHQGQFPTDYDAILELPGIGRYTAGAISSIAFNQPRPLVDGNVVRVLSRLFAIAGDPKDKGAANQFWSLAGELVGAAARSRPVRLPAHSPLLLAGNCSALNQALMELGATVCTPVNPRCVECPVRGLCAAYQTRQVDRFPEKAKRPRATRRRFVAFVIQRGAKVLVRQRPAGVVNAHLWEFPNVEIGLREKDPVAAAARALEFELHDIRSLEVIRHGITRYRIALEGHAANLRGRGTGLGGVWRSRAQLGELAFAAAHQKLARRAGLPA